ncbi:hypothetical protein D3C83_150650 [compost metagenome]
MHDPVGFFLQQRPGGARNDAGDSAAMREHAVRGVDDRFDWLLEQVAPHYLEQARGAETDFSEDLGRHARPLAR